MLHFIPSWYLQGQWCENEQKWYTRHTHTEFDDTVKQIQLFHRKKVYPFQIMLLGYSPNFRHFLHRQGVSRVSYWSCFDAMQEVTRKKPMLLSFHHLNWPEHTEFIYTPFVVQALVKGEKYAQIEFGEDGNPIQVDMFANGIIQRRNIYDDRGFVSGTILYREGKPYLRDYLTEQGIRKIRYFYHDNHVEININSPTYTLNYGDKSKQLRYSKNSYLSMEELISEVLASYLEMVDENDLFCVALDKQHNKVLYSLLQHKNMIVSIFEDRCNLADGEALRIINSAAYIVTDSNNNLKNVNCYISDKDIPQEEISPYDTRIDFGISQQISAQKILVPVDGLLEEEYEQLINILGHYLEKNKHAQIHLFTRQSDYRRESELLDKTKTYLIQYGYPEYWAISEEEKGRGENRLDKIDKDIRFFVEQCVNEYNVSKCMREQRIVLDIRKNTEVYLRVLAISMGIPQLVGIETEFVKEGKNGFVIKNLNEIEKYLDFYLEGLANWNEAMVYCYEIGKKYNTEELITRWKEVIKVARNH